jgi:hypothetical protein
LRVGGYQDRQELQIEFYDWIECSTESDLSNKYSFLFHFRRIPVFVGFCRGLTQNAGYSGLRQAGSFSHCCEASYQVWFWQASMLCEFKTSQGRNPRHIAGFGTPDMSRVQPAG